MLTVLHFVPYASAELRRKALLLRADALVHERMAWVRGVENGFATARSAKTGYVSAHSAYGTSFASSSTFAQDPAIVVANLPLGPGTTLYTRFGDWFGWLAVIASLAILIVVFLQSSGSGE